MFPSQANNRQSENPHSLCHKTTSEQFCREMGMFYIFYFSKLDVFITSLECLCVGLCLWITWEQMPTTTRREQHVVQLKFQTVSHPVQILGTEPRASGRTLSEPTLQPLYLIFLIVHFNFILWKRIFTYLKHLNMHILKTYSFWVCLKQKDIQARRENI